MTKLDPKLFYYWKRPRQIVDIRPEGAFSRGSFEGAISHPYDISVPLTAFSKELGRKYWQKDLHIIDIDGTTSSRLAELLPISYLKNGYKGFKIWRKKIFSIPCFIVLAGLTGSGKTKLLEKMAINGMQVIHLEKLAMHRGSAFGSMADAQPKHEDFQNRLLDLCLSKDWDLPIWIEEKGDYLGSVGLPETIKLQIDQAPRVLLNVPFDKRLKNILSGYEHLAADHFRLAIKKLEKRMGTSENHKALYYYNSGELEKCMELLLQYYDRAYNARRHKTEAVNKIELQIRDREQVIERLKTFEEELIKRESPRR